ncbi:hypothetical protein LSAT2_011306 [Lamellibrachia satsuma]|nr:hypothetical protein LSAT2_011306 [Lamellibrachia satsuma]
MGLLGAQSSNTGEMTQSGQVPRQRKGTTYMIDGRTVCREAFKFLLCLRQGRLLALQKNQLSPRRKPTHGGRKYNTKALSNVDAQHVVQVIKAYTEDHGLCLPGSADVMVRATEGEEQPLQLLKDRNHLPPITLPAPIKPPDGGGLAQKAEAMKQQGSRKGEEDDKWREKAVDREKWREKAIDREKWREKVTDREKWREKITDREK